MGKFKFETGVQLIVECERNTDANSTIRTGKVRVDNGTWRTLSEQALRELFGSIAIVEKSEPQGE